MVKPIKMENLLEVQGVHEVQEIPNKMKGYIQIVCCQSSVHSKIQMTCNNRKNRQFYANIPLVLAIPVQREKRHIFSLDIVIKSAFHTVDNVNKV